MHTLKWLITTTIGPLHRKVYFTFCTRMEVFFVLIPPLLVVLRNIKRYQKPIRNKDFSTGYAHTKKVIELNVMR